MNILKTLFLTGVIALVATSGISLASDRPDASLLDKVPTVTMGQPEVRYNDYALYIPGGQTFPVELSLSGDLIRGKHSQTIEVQLDRDVYLYQTWISYDGKQWSDTKETVGIGISMGLDHEKAQFGFSIDPEH